AARGRPSRPAVPQGAASWSWLVRTGELRRPEHHQWGDAVRIDADDDIAREFLGVFPLVGRARRDDEDISLRDRHVPGPDRRRAGASPAVAGADGAALPVGDLPAKFHAPLAFDDVIHLGDVVMHSVVRVLLSLVTIDHADADLVPVAAATRLDHVHRNIVFPGSNHVSLVRLDL